MTRIFITKDKNKTAEYWKTKYQNLLKHYTRQVYLIRSLRNKLEEKDEFNQALLFEILKLEQERNV